MPRMRVLTALALLAALPAAAAAQAAPLARPATPRVGLLAGFTSSTIAADDDEDVPTRRRNGFLGGAYLALPLGTGGLALRPELLYVQKGARIREADFEVDATIQLDYVEVPVLLEYTVPVTGGLRPQFYAGPAFGYQARCAVSARGGGLSVSGSCDDLSDDADDPTARRRFEASGVVGGALAFGAGRQQVTVGARYTHGFSELFEDSSAKNRAFSLYASLEFPIARARR